MYISTRMENELLFWTIRRPERRNALGTQIGQEMLGLCLNLLEQWERAEKSRNLLPCRALVLSAEPVEQAEGQAIWIAGGDLQELALLQDPQQGRAYAEEWCRILQTFLSLPIPVIGLIDGAAIGGGVEFLLATDLRLATQRSSLHFKQLEVGLATGYGSCQRLVQLLGLSKATQLLFLSSKVESAEAQRLGLFHEVCPDRKSAEVQLQHWLAHLSRLSPESLKAQKRMLLGPQQESLNSRQEFELQQFQQLWMNSAHKKFLQAFQKSRSP